MADFVKFAVRNICSSTHLSTFHDFHVFNTELYNAFVLKFIFLLLELVLYKFHIENM